MSKTGIIIALPMTGIMAFTVGGCGTAGTSETETEAVPEIAQNTPGSDK